VTQDSAVHPDHSGRGGAIGFAGFWRRAGAVAIDLWIIYILTVIVTVITSLILLIPLETINALTLAAYLSVGVVAWLYHMLMETSPMQGTIGKWAMGIQVVDLDGCRIGWVKATARHFGKVLSALPFGLGFLVVGFTKYTQGWHDMMAETLVVLREDGSRGREGRRHFFWGPAMSVAALVAALGGADSWINTFYTQDFDPVKGAWVMCPRNVIRNPFAPFGAAIAFGLIAYTGLLSARWVFTYPHQGWRRLALLLSMGSAGVMAVIAYRRYYENYYLGHGNAVEATIQSGIVALFVAPIVLLSGRELFVWVWRGFKPPAH